MALVWVSMRMVSPDSTRAMGPPSTASGATWPMQKPWVPPEKRPSVTRATFSERPAPTMAEVGVSISGMPGPPFGPWYRTTTTAPGGTTAAFDGPEGAPLRSRRPPLCPRRRDLLFRRSCRRRPRGRGTPGARRGDRRLSRASPAAEGSPRHSFSSSKGRRLLREGEACNGEGLGVGENMEVDQVREQCGRAAGVVEVLHEARSPGLHVREDGRSLTDALEVVVVQGQLEGPGDGQHVEDGVRRAARGLDDRDGVLGGFFGADVPGLEVRLEDGPP
mmetsp:Transcript_30771/g.99192  ORF Transcript_30771/g.99192 Transcript_30771/m.99192 type:complete len:276 (-) Transcript_30771:147-974(-)